MNHQTLIQQLGTALPMMGAKDLVKNDFNLTFKIGRNPEGVTHIKITLRADDTYNVDAIRWNARKFEATPKGSVQAVYADRLHATLESLTGLYTRL